MYFNSVNDENVLIGINPDRSSNGKSMWVI